MSKETFARGFCKVAQANGVDPVALAKYAQASDGPIKAPYDDKWELGTDLPSPSNPSPRDWTYLFSLNPYKINRDAAAAGIKEKDFWDALYKISPEHAVRIGRNIIEDDGRALDAAQFKEYGTLKQLNNSIQRFPSLANAMYSAATNTLDKIQQNTGKKIWDVPNARGTLYGVTRDMETEDMARDYRRKMNVDAALAAANAARAAARLNAIRAAANTARDASNVASAAARLSAKQVKMPASTAVPSNK